jgi:hypothetical protein
MNVPEGCELIVRVEKITDYLLNLNHPDGRPKALFFIANGLNGSSPEPFITLLYKHFETNSNNLILETQFGTKFIIEGNMTMPNGSIHLLRSIWIREHENKFIKFVTAYKI